jgi:hypothetical protein
MSLRSGTPSICSSSGSRKLLARCWPRRSRSCCAIASSIRLANGRTGKIASGAGHAVPGLAPLYLTTFGWAPVLVSISPGTLGGVANEARAMSFASAIAMRFSSAVARASRSALRSRAHPGTSSW